MLQGNEKSCEAACKHVYINAVQSSDARNLLCTRESSAGLLAASEDKANILSPVTKVGLERVHGYETFLGRNVTAFRI